MTTATEGDPAGLRTLARQQGARAEHLREAERALVGALAEARAHWHGAAATKFGRVAESVPPGLRRTADLYDTAALTLHAYARTVESIQDDAWHLRDAPADDPRWSELEARRKHADRRAVADLQSEAVTGQAFRLRTGVAALSDGQVLAALGAMPPEQLASLADDRGLQERLSAMSADAVARWWDGLGGVGTADAHSTAQAWLITSLPGLIGNLGGVPFWARDRANRTAATAELARWRQRVVDAERVGSEPNNDRVERARAQARALENFLAVGRRTPGEGEPPRQMIVFRPGEPPLGAWSVGDLDQVASISFLVPGMGSSLADSTVYVRAATNVQQLHPPGSSAVVVWMGYEPPPSFVTTGSLGVFAEGYAERGAVRLADDLRAVRGRRADAALNVIGHSYGSTTAAIALADAPELRVRSFVTLGSAGIPGRLASASDTNAEAMYAAQAAEQFDVAFIGRKYSVPHRSDPVRDFGATVIDTRGPGTVNEHGLLANPQNGRRGYLDVGTNTLIETANVTGP